MPNIRGNIAFKCYSKKLKVLSYGSNTSIELSNAQRVTNLKKSVIGLRVRMPKFRVQKHRDLKT